MLLVAFVLYLIWRRRDWLSASGWATVALIASLSWLMPWYVVWVLPLAALGTSVRLRGAALVLTLFLMVTFAPELALYMKQHHINPLRSAGRPGFADARRRRFRPRSRAFAALKTRS